MTTRLVVFDLDGTLVDSIRDLATAVNAALEALEPGTRPLDLATVTSFVGDGITRLLARSLERAKLPHGVEQAQPPFLEAYRRCLLDTTRLYPGVEDVLENLAQRGVRAAVLTNKAGDLSRTILDGLGVGAWFMRVVGADDAPARKPDPRGLLGLMEQASSARTETVLVGDSPVDVATGHAAGVFVVGVSYGLAPAVLRQAHPEIVIDDLRALPAELNRLTMLR